MRLTNFFRLISPMRNATLALASTALLLLSSTGANAEPLTREQARQRAAQFLSTRKGSRQLKAVDADHRLSPRRHVRKLKGLASDTLDLYYVFDRGSEQGFVIVSGDDQTTPVLGYTEQGHFDYSQLPPNMREWLTGYENQLDAIRRSSAPIVKANIPTHDPVAQLCTSKWNQGDPYNQSCPMYFTLGRSVTGCVATAMAQILYYHRSKMVTETQAQIPAYQAWAEKPYNNQYLQVEAVPANSPIDWENMLDTYGGSATAKQKKAVADLMWYCGASVEMGYTNSSSGANSYKVAEALPKYFGFGSSVQYHYKDNEGIDEVRWDAMIYNELANARPVYLSGANSGGGHAFVCDGYDGNQCYHINWGWGGMSDGYFLLSSLTPGSQGIGGSGDGYSQYRECVIGIEPINFGTRAIPFDNAVVKRLCTTAFDSNADGVLTYGEAATVSDLGDTFKGSSITSFNELYNFTSLTAIPDEAFSGCSRLTSIKLPKAMKSIGDRAFADCRQLKEINLHDDITSIGEGAFSGCRVLPNITLPSGLQSIENNSFENCLAFTAVSLPLSIQHIGSRAFAGCIKLKTFTVKSINPESITLGTDVWADIDLSEATLNALQGSREFFATAPQWCNFGNLYQQRTLNQGQFVEIDVNTNYYVYNVGTGRYLTKGEAWGTQAIVEDTDEPMRFQLRRTSSMPEGVYYLYSPDTDNSNHILFRTSSDNKIGNGIKACFVDGPTSHVSDKTAYWKFTAVEGAANVYTIQIPSGVSGYKAEQYLGVQPSHASNAAVPTYGIYSDILISDYTANCHWMFTPYDEAQAATFQKALQLENLLAIAKKKKLDTTKEDAIYNDFNSSDEDIAQACARLRKKLNFIPFVDDVMRRVCLNSIDADSDGEISFKEASNVETLNNIFTDNTTVTNVSDLKYFTKLQYLAGNEFKGCTALTKAVLPESLTGVYYRSFLNCKALTSVELPLNINSIGDDAFNGCTNLKEVRVNAPNPSSIGLGDNVFKNVPVSSAILYVPYGSKELYAKADVWKTFGEIREMRALRWPDFVEPEVGKEYYVYNLAQRAYINKGEAYGTQAVVANNGFVYKLGRSSSMPENTYYLQSADAGSDGHNYLFRTSTDSKVGVGVKACFVDGQLSAAAYWTLNVVGNNIYTLQVPSNQTDYVAGEYLGTDYGHTTDASYGTYGLYWDISYNESAPANAQWAFISVDEVNAEREFFERTEVLKELLARANQQSIAVDAEQAVYDNFESSEQQIEDAITSVRSKLHYVTFIDERMQLLTINRWDLNDDEDLSTDELANVTDISDVFKGTTLIKSLEDLKFFTAISEIPAEAFRGNSNVVSAIVPANVNAIGEKAFYGTSKLKYIALLNASRVVDGASSGISVRNLTVFVPASLVDAYKADAFWGGAEVQPYTGIPTITAEPVSRQYGRVNPKFTYVVTGAPISGEPLLTTEATAETGVGDYDITVANGTVKSFGLQCVKGTLTIERAPLTVTAQSYTRNKGEENPEFEVRYSSLRNREKIADVLLKEPVITCDATADSPGGTYEIRVSGAEAANYEFTYVNGTLTVLDPVGINAARTDKAKADIYDLAGRKVTNASNGIYVRDGKKVVVNNK